MSAKTKKKSRGDAFINIFIQPNDTGDGVSTESTLNYKKEGCYKAPMYY